MATISIEKNPAVDEYLGLCYPGLFLGRFCLLGLFFWRRGPSWNVGFVLFNFGLVYWNEQ